MVLSEHIKHMLRFTTGYIAFRNQGCCQLNGLQKLMYKGYRRGTSCKYANNTFCLQCTGKQVVISRQEKRIRNR